MSYLDPNYLNIDFNTLISRLKTQIQASDIFKDVNYEGANITMLMELMSYIGELNIYFQNKIAKNIFDETSDIFETSHALARQKGYDPKGYISSNGFVLIHIDNSDTVIRPGDYLKIENWSEMKSKNSVKNGSDLIYFSTTADLPRINDDDDYYYYYLIGQNNIKNFDSEGTSGNWVDISVPIKQGRVKTYTMFGRDMVDNKIILPLKKFDYDSSIADGIPSIEVFINGTSWRRVSDFYEEMSGLEGEETNIYKFEFDKYQRYVVVFSNQRSVPNENDEIIIKCLETIGKDGNVRTDSLDSLVSPNTFVYNETTGAYINGENISIINLAGLGGGQDPESLSEIRENSRRLQHSQFRNVTKDDYIGTLEARSDVVRANAWGEMEISPSAGDTREYNKVYLTVIPPDFNSFSMGVLSTPVSRQVTLNSNSYTLNSSILEPFQYNSAYSSTIIKSIEATKMLTTYEVLRLPQFIYFWFDIELRVKRLYTYQMVKEDVLRKLIYYFDKTNRQFGETIDFMKILNYIVDPYEYSTDGDTFSNIRGIENIEFRDVGSPNTLYEPNTNLNPRLYPQYTVDDMKWVGDNRLRQVKLDYNQFPFLISDFCIFYNTI